MPKRNAREKVLSSFHSLSLNEIEKVWGNLYLSVGKELTMDRMMRQYTNEKVFAEIYLSHFVATDSQASTSSATATGSSGLTVDEENIVRYIAGYVPLRLMRKYEKQGSSKAAVFVETLSSMKVNGQEVNRGGLFEMNESSYYLFRMLVC